MEDHVKRMINELPMKIVKVGTSLTPAGNNIFEKVNIKRMDKKETEEFHTSVLSGIFVAKIARLNFKSQ